VRTLLARDRQLAAERPEREPLRRIFGEGIGVNLLNPRTALFFFAFLPQFVNPGGSVRLQIALLGLTFSAMGMVTDTVYATVAGTIANRLRDDERFPRIRRISVSVVYLGLALLAVLAHPTK